MAARGAATGAASGAAAGLVVSLMCGPWYFECAAAMVPGMMASGGATDAIAGGVTSLSKEDTERFNRYLQTLPERRNLNEEMARRLADALPAERLATESADARLTIGIGAIQVFQSEVKTLELKLTALAALERHPGSRNPGGTEQSFTCTSERREVDEWLAHEGRALDSAITSCVNELAAKVNAALQEGPAR